MPDDPYGALHYRTVIRWPERLAREWPLFDQAFSQVRTRRVLDLGSGTGDHAAFLAAHGFEVVGIDASQAMVEHARAKAAGDRVAFVLGDITRVDDLVEGTFGAAICVGNTLPHVANETDLGRLAEGVARRLERGGVLVLQVLNYERIFGRRIRYLPPTFRDEGGEEHVFLRLMDPQPDGRTVIFCPSTFRYRPAADPPLELLASRRVVLRGWRRSDVEMALDRAGFVAPQVYGSVDRQPYVPLESPDLIMVARTK